MNWVVRAAVGLVAFLISFSVCSPATADDEWKLEKGDSVWIWKKGEESIPAVSDELLKLYASAQVASAPGIGHQVLYLSPEEAIGGAISAAKLLVLTPGKTQTEAIRLEYASEKAGGDSKVGLVPFKIQIHRDGFFFASTMGAKVLIGSYLLASHELKMISVLEIGQVRTKDVRFIFAPQGVTVETTTTRAVYGTNGDKIDSGLQFYELTPDNEDTLVNIFKAVDLTSAARQGKLEPSLGREDTVQTLLNYFKLPNRNSSVLVENRPGVEAEGIVHLLASLIARDKVRVRGETGWKVYELNWTQFNAQGQVNLTPDKIKDLLTLCRQKRVILYFPDLEQLKGLGVDQRTGANDATAALQQDLQAGRVILLGKTGISGWNQLLATADTFTATLNKVSIDPPARPELKKLLSAYAASREAADGSVKFSPDAIDRLIDLSNQFIPDTEEAQPRKALLAIRNIYANPRKYLGETELPVGATLNVDEQIIKNYLAEKSGIASLAGGNGLEKFVLEENYWPAMDKQVIGHHAAKEAVLNMLIGVSEHRPLKVDGAGNERGIRSVLLLGSSGTGKSFFPEALAKALAKYGVNWEPITIELGSAKTEGSGSSLTGASPGFIGFKEEGSKFVQALRANRQTVLVLEELDKAHPNAWHTLYSFLDEGKFQDANLNNVKWTRGIVIATSNYGAQGSEGGVIKDENGKEIVLLEDDSADLVDQYDGWKILGREPRNKAVKGWDEDELKAKLIEGLERKHENLAQLIGRMSHVEILHHFTEEEFRKLLELFKGILVSNMAASYGVKLEYSPDAERYLFEQAWGKDGMNAFNHGARAAIKLITEKIDPTLRRIRKRTDFRNVDLKGRRWILIVKKDEKGREQIDVELVPQAEPQK